MGKVKNPTYSYFDWLPTRKSFTQMNAMHTAIASTVALGLIYLLWNAFDDTSNPNQNNYCANSLTPEMDAPSTALEQLETVASLSIPLFQGTLGALAAGAFVNREQQRTQLSEVDTSLSSLISVERISDQAKELSAFESVVDAIDVGMVLHNSLIDSKTKIIHIPQQHWTSEMQNNPSLIEKVWESQFRVLEQLILYPNAAVFAEGITETTHYDDTGPYTQLANTFFPEGISKSKSSWDAHQKQFLIKYGAARVLHFLGIIKTLYRSADPKTHKLLISEINALLPVVDSTCDDRIRELIFDRREEDLAKEVREFLQESENRDRLILIVYGASHDLADYFPNMHFSRLTNEPNAEEVNPCIRPPA